MRANKLVVALFFFFTCHLFSQNDGRKLLHFRIVADTASVDQINIINLVTEQTAISDSQGHFSITAKPDDLLVLTAVNFEYKRKIIEESDFNENIITIKMVAKVTQLKEVVINQFPNINTRALGIVPYNQKVYTPAERRLHTASSGPIDVMANLISGRSKQLKKQLEISKKELLLEKVEFLYDDTYYVDTLKIAPDYIRGFQYYMIEDAQFVSALKTKNKTMLLFVVSKLATEYKAMLAQK